MARSNMYRSETWRAIKTVDPNDQMIKEAKRIGISFEIKVREKHVISGIIS